MVTFILAAMVGAQEPTTLASKITSASIYRSGLTLVTREVTVPAGKGTYKLDAVPSALDGGFWFGSPDDVKVQDVRTKLKTEEKTVDFEPQTIGDFMAANIGKKIRYGIIEATNVGGNYRSEMKWRTGTLVRIGPPPSGVALIKLEDGTLLFVSPSSISELDPNGLDLTWKRKVTEYSVHATFAVDAPKPSRVRFTTLERGPMWLPSFMIDFDSRTSATLFAKVQLGLPGWTLDNTDVQLLAGKPALIDATGMADLASGQTTLEGFANGRSASLFPGKPDPFESVVRAELLSYSGFVGGGGEFGGGGGGGGLGGRIAMSEATTPTPATPIKSLTNPKSTAVSASTKSRWASSRWSRASDSPETSSARKGRSAGLLNSSSPKAYPPQSGIESASKTKAD